MKRIQRALDWIVPLLQSRGVPFHITGGFAAHLYGARREVNDIDIDLPTTSLQSLLPELTAYVEFPAQRHKDTTWDLYVCTLDYDGQLIDLTGDSEAFIHSKTSGAWEPLEINLHDVRWIDAFGHTLPVQNPTDLICYKRKIAYDEEKHLEDVKAVQQYVAGGNAR